MTVIRALLGAFNTAVHSATTTLLVLLSVLLTAVVVLTVVGAAGISITGILGLGLRRRRRPEGSR